MLTESIESENIIASMMVASDRFLCRAPSEIRSASLQYAVVFFSSNRVAEKYSYAAGLLNIHYKKSNVRQNKTALQKKRDMDVLSQLLGTISLRRQPFWTIPTTFAMKPSSHSCTRKNEVEFPPITRQFLIQ